MDASESGIDDAGLARAKRIKELDATGNANIRTVVPFARSLRKLFAGNICGIDDAGLAHATRIVELNADDNEKIHTVAPFEKSLRRLHARWNCGLSYAGRIDATNRGPFRGIGDAGLTGATRIEMLDAGGNPSIRTLAPFALSLRKLNASGWACGIDDTALAQVMRVVSLDARDNTNISTPATRIAVLRR